MTTVAEYHRDVKARLIADPLIRRFDIRRERQTRTDHYPHLSDAPHHIHDGQQDNVLPGAPTKIAQVLDEIAEHLSQ